MSTLLLGAAIAVMAAAAVGIGFGVRVPLADRLRPYRPSPSAHSSADGSAWTPHSGARREGGSPIGFGAILHRFRRLWPSSADARLAAQLDAAGVDDRDIDDVRIRQVGQSAGFAAAGVVLGGIVLHSPVMTLVLAGCGGAVGFTRAPARVARLGEERRTRMRLELVTIDQILAIHVRAGAGPVQAVTRLTDRADGVVIDELRAILVSIRSGRSESEAFRYAAATTAEPHAARTYRLFALAAEHGADLGGALRALSDDLRDVRRDELRRSSTRRRAAMLVPTIAVLAPIMLVFVIAPLPSIVLGGH
jgi:tight adherence protein C